MSLPIQTLHSLVFNLITDNAFGAEFLSDPTSVLSAAGLTDITGTDAFEATSLVTDQLPAPVAGVVETGLAAVPTDLVGTDDFTCAVAHLQGVAAAAQGLPATGTTLADTAFGELSGATDAFSLSGTFGGTGGGFTSELIAGTPAGDVAGALAATANGALAGGLDTPLGTYGLTTDSLSVPSFDSVGDLGSTLDVASLTDGSSSAGATVTGYAAQGTDLVASGISNGSALLGDHLTSAGASLGEAVTTGGADLADHVSSGGAIVNSVASSLPALPTPAHLPTDLPVHVMAEPHDLPAVPGVPDLQATVAGATSHATALADSVSHGSLAATAHSALPVDTDNVTGNLLHGDIIPGL